MKIPQLKFSEGYLRNQPMFAAPDRVFTNSMSVDDSYEMAWEVIARAALVSNILKYGSIKRRDVAEL